MIKKIILVVLMVCLIVLIPKTTQADSIESFLIITHDGRYIFGGVDFAAEDDAAVDIFAFSLSWKKFGGYWYAAVSQNYFEWGVDLNGTISFKGIDFKSTFFPFGWTAHGKTYWGFMVLENITVNTPVLPIIGKWAYAYVPDLRDLDGHYFCLGTQKDFLEFNCQAGLNYNDHMFTGGGKGLGAIFGISKSIELTKKVSLDLYFKYYLNHPDVNEDEQVIGASIAIKL